MRQRTGALARLTLSDPRAAARELMQDRAAQARAIELAGLVVIAGVAFSWLLSVLLPGPTVAILDTMLSKPLLYALIQFMLLMISVLAIFMVGRLFGGTGSFEQTLLLSVWLQFYMLVVQVAAAGVVLLVPGLAGLLNIAIMIYFVWLTVNFIAELHGFRSLWKILAGLLGTAFALAILASLILSLLGVSMVMDGH